MPKRGATKRPLVASNLVYGGGPIENTPTVYLVFWGSQWDSDTNGVQSYLTNYFNGVGTGWTTGPRS